jgi:hypothetical protein
MPRGRVGHDLAEQLRVLATPQASDLGGKLIWVLGTPYVTELNRFGWAPNVGSTHIPRLVTSGLPMIVFSDLAVVQVSLPEVVIEPVFIPYTFNRAAPFPLGAEETVPCGDLTFTRRETTHQTGQGSGLDVAL